MSTHARRYVLSTMIAIIVGFMAACASTPERRGTGEVVDDAALTARVKTALVKAEGLRGAAEINVNSYRGEVQLTGFVESDDMIQRALTAARNVDGVRVVRNDLRVRPRQ